MVAAAIFSVGVSTTPQAKAANLYWDTDTAIAGTGGTGVWTDDKSSNWSVTAAGDTAAGAGTFGAGDVAFFTGTAGTVTLGGPITIGGLVFSGADFTVTGDTLTLAAASGAPTVSVTGGNVATLSSIVAGSNGLTKSGNGVLRLTNASNSYTGVSTISGGALVISSGAALGTDASAISILSANQTPGSTILYGYGGGALVLDGTAAGFTFARNINFEGRGPVGERSAAILSLGNNVLSGTLTSAVSPLSPATFRNTRITSVNGTLTLSGTVISRNLHRLGRGQYHRRGRFQFVRRVVGYRQHHQGRSRHFVSQPLGDCGFFRDDSSRGRLRRSAEFRTRHPGERGWDERLRGERRHGWQQRHRHEWRRAGTT
jgi:autotransporter-associated beta strand protein